MSGFQYAMVMFTLVLILIKVSPPTEHAVWWIVEGMWFMAMVISLTKQLIEYGKKNNKNNRDSDGE
jgi:hypothetical protein